MKANESYCSACGGAMINQSTCLQCKRSARIYDNYIKEKHQPKEEELSTSHLLSLLALPVGTIILIILLWIILVVVGAKAFNKNSYLNSYEYQQINQEPGDLL